MHQMEINKQLLKVCENGIERENELQKKLEDNSFVVLKLKYEHALNRLFDLEEA